MNITMLAKVKFEFNLNADQLRVLIVCSEAHYDHVCQTSSQPGGFIYGWKNTLAWQAEASKESCPVVNFMSPVEAQVTASWREFDTCAKILEGTHVLNESDKKIARKISNDFVNAMRQANEKIHSISIAVE